MVSVKNVPNCKFSLKKIQNFSLVVEEKTKKNEYEVSGFCKTVKIKQAGKKKKKVSSENSVIKYIIE